MASLLELRFALVRPDIAVRSQGADSLGLVSSKGWDCNNVVSKSLGSNSYTRRRCLNGDSNAIGVNYGIDVQPACRYAEA